MEELPQYSFEAQAHPIPTSIMLEIPLNIHSTVVKELEKLEAAELTEKRQLRSLGTADSSLNISEVA
ncbi:hypothetical protein NDU88_010310 [Pleurodeles waltl]|uniref:Uncharacterized protein n=1 Tax=Pleurodeles waltl TaxID=8319 RepID=A0AAV7PYB9_PLEWA|nr:hypothetical protein NDU88_010310 [Pleurodeles waltl]